MNAFRRRLTQICSHLRTVRGLAAWRWISRARRDSPIRPTYRQLEAQVAESAQALRLSEARNRAILSTIPDMISLVSREGIHLDSINRNPQIDLVSPEVCLVGQSIADYLPPEIVAQKLAAIERALSTGQMQTYEQAVQRQERLQYEELRVLPYGADTALILIRDITDRRQAELELEQAKAAASQTRSAFLANMSHDLRTPLNAILGYGQLMAQEAQTPQQQAQLDIINRNAEQLLRLINQILSLTKTSLTKTPLTKTPLTKTSLTKTSLTKTEAGEARLKPANLLIAQTGTPRRRGSRLAPGQPAHRILVVDDTPPNRMLLTHWLKRAGFEVEQAENGRVGVERAMQFRPDLIWMDMRMPVMDGLEAMQLIRQVAEESRGWALTAMQANREQDQPWQPKIIALTAAAFEEEHQQILAAGFDDVVAKPCSESVFFDKIAQHLRLCRSPELPYPEAAESGCSVPQSELPFAIMPADWLAQLHYAARSANEPLIFELLEALPADCHDLKKSATQLVHNFQLSQLIRLTQPDAQPSAQPSAQSSAQP